jgi:hypothetical protein
MGEMRKITVSLPASLVEASLHTSGKGLTETIREALAAQNHAWACRQLLAMRGKIDLRADYAELTGKDDREW